MAYYRKDDLLPPPNLQLPIPVSSRDFEIMACRYPNNESMSTSNARPFMKMESVSE